jgi:hypothetical protein
VALAAGLSHGAENNLCYIEAMHPAAFFFSYFWFSNACGGREF